MRTKDLQRINKMAIICHGVIDGIITAAYLLEVIKGSRDIPYFLMIAAVAVLPIVAETIIYRKKKDSTRIKRLMGLTYSLLYAIAILTTHSVLPFTYAIPMLLVITLYSDPGFCLRIGAGAVLLNVIDVAYKAVNVGIAAEDMPDLEIRMFLMTLVAIYVYLTTRMIKSINEGNAADMRKEKDIIEKLLTDVMHISRDMTVKVADVAEHMSALDVSTNEMGGAMEEVNAGTLETAESVQNQLIRTEEIQRLIEEVGEASRMIKEGMESAFTEIENGMVSMQELSKQAEQSKQANTTVVTLMNELQEQTEKMDEIINVITSVANSTGMLALNASIEAARAGEAGRGFAVVATQVSTLSDQTKKAAVNITELIQKVVSELRQVTEAVGVLEQNTNAQDEKASKVGKSFQVITEMAGSVVENAKGMETKVENLSTANGDIVQNIQTISAVTEEVTAHSNQTMSACEENIKIVEQVKEITVQLSNYAKELQAAQAADSEEVELS